MSNDTRFLDDILKVNDEERNVKMSESQFKTLVLPLITQPDTNDASLDTWLKLTGSWQKGINVYDDRDGKTFLFEVPALVPTSSVRPRSKGGPSVNDIIEDSTRKMAVIPRAGQEYLVRSLSNKVDPSGDRSENVNKWNYIYQRYGLEQYVIENGQGDSTVSDTISDVSGYDEL